MYPAFDLYPATVGIAPTKAEKEKSVVLSGSYAAFNLCKLDVSLMPTTIR